ncbi:MAG: Hint domain-containing protein [Pseudomonadota bacterium]
MVASLDGIVFHQIYGDNSGGDEFDTDGDGTATQEDEFVSVMNTTDAPLDVSGWQIWSDSTGTNAPDKPQDGLFHTFPKGTVLEPGETLYIINEITGTPAAWMQEASEGGVESGADGTSTNLLSEGSSGSASESVALLNPSTGDYIVVNFSPSASHIPNLPGFAGKTNVGESNAAEESGQADWAAGFSYQYVPGEEDDEGGSYCYDPVYVPCFAPGTLILTPSGARPVELLRAGDLVETADRGAQPLRWCGSWTLRFGSPETDCQKPIEIKAGALGRNLPHRDLVVSPQHRMVFSGPHVAHRTGVTEAIGPAVGLAGAPQIRQMSGKHAITYHALLLDRHEIIFAEGAPTESFYPGAFVLGQLAPKVREEVFAIHPRLRTRPGTGIGPPARTILKRHDVEALAQDGPSLADDLRPGSGVSAATDAQAHAPAGPRAGTKAA